MEPLYVHVPSVRKSVSGMLSKWFVHAMEVKAGPADTQMAQRLNESAQTPKTVRRELERILKRLQARGRLGIHKIERDIHFIVADNSALFEDAPMDQTHTLQALALARALNRLGNAHGIFVHYITPADIHDEFGNEVRAATEERPSPFGHVKFHERRERLTGPGERVKGPSKHWTFRTSPGEATNIALAYGRGFHEARYGQSEALLLRVGDDVVPASHKLGEGKNRGFRNFFEDQEAILNGAESRRTYGGYDDNTGKRLANGKLPNSAEFILRRVDFASFPYYSGAQNEDLFRKDAHATSFRTPAYLIHAGKTSAYKGRPGSFGKYWFNSRNRVAARGGAFNRNVATASGIAGAEKLTFSGPVNAPLEKPQSGFPSVWKIVKNHRPR